MDQATKAPDAYEEHVRKLHTKIEEEEKVTPKPVTCNITLQSDEVEGILWMIEDHFGKYGVKSQALLVRVATKLRDALLLD